MKSIQIIEHKISTPSEVEINLSNKIIEVKGPLGNLKEDFTHLPVEISANKEEILIRAYYPKKKTASLVYTAASHINNMIKGVTEGFTYKLKVAYAHFPITVKINDNKKVVLIENFIGERTPRIAKIMGDVKVKVSSDDITVEGISLKNVSQTAANIQNSTKIKKKDQRVFLDGIYIYNKKKA